MGEENILVIGMTAFFVAFVVWDKHRKKREANPPKGFEVITTEPADERPAEGLQK